MAKRLTKKHPLSIKIDKLFAFLEENKLCIERSYDGVLIYDHETELTVKVLDSDDDQPIQDLPSSFEYKLIIAE